MTFRPQRQWKKQLRLLLYQGFMSQRLKNNSITIISWSNGTWLQPEPQVYIHWVLIELIGPTKAPPEKLRFSPLFLIPVIWNLKVPSSQYLQPSIKCSSTTAALKQFTIDLCDSLLNSTLRLLCDLIRYVSDLSYPKLKMNLNLY